MNTLSYVRLFPKFYCTANVTDEKLEFVISDDSRTLTDVEMGILTEAMAEVENTFEEKRQEGFIMSPLSVECALQRTTIRLARRIGK